MDDQPLAGHSIRCSSTSAAAQMAAFVLSDLGARVITVPAAAAADVGDACAESADVRVRLSGFGEHGRFAAAPDHHSAVEAVGGAQMGQYTYEPGPAYLVSPYSTVGQALLAAAAILADLLGDRHGSTPVSALQGLLAIQSGFYVFGPEPEPRRFLHSPRGQTPVYSTYRAADDWLFIGASTTPFMIKVLEAFGLDSALEDPRLHGGAPALRTSDIAAELWERIEPIVRSRPRQHWLERFEQRKVPAGPLLTLEEALAHPHMREAGLAEPGEPVGRLKNLVHVTRRALTPTLSQREKGSTVDARPRPFGANGPGPLAGLRVVELAGYIAGSYAGRLLRDLGADVVKVEPPDGDPFRQNGYGFVAWNHSKKSLALNLRLPADRTRLLSLVAEADVLVTNYRPDALARLGAGRDDLFAVNPVLIHCAVSAYGERGPLAHLQGFDPVVQAFTGIMKRQGGDDEPVKPQMAATDYLSAMLAAIGVLAARVAQLERGGGYCVDTSLLAGAMLLNYPAYEALRAGRSYLRGGRDFKGLQPLNGLHKAAGGWLLTAASEALTPGPSPILGRGANGRGEQKRRPRRFLDSDLPLENVEAAIERLRQLGVPAVPALTPWDLPAEAHFRDNGLFITLEQPELGELTLPAPVFGSPDNITPAPSCGQDNARMESWD